MVAGYWLLVTGYWLLVAGYDALAVSLILASRRRRARRCGRCWQFTTASMSGPHAFLRMTVLSRAVKSESPRGIGEATRSSRVWC